MTDRIDGLINLIKNDYVISIRENDFKDSHMFEHTDGSYKVIDWGDRDNVIKIDSRSCLTDNKCQFVLKCQLRPESPEKLRPFFYCDKGSAKFLQIFQELRSNPKNGFKSKMYWRGNAHLEREIVLTKLGSQYLNSDYMEKQHKDMFYQEMSHAKLALSLPGLGKACHREFEAFAVGTPVIMPRFDNLFYVNIIPNFHYVSVDVEGRDIAEAIKERYHEVINNTDFLAYIRQNAIEYYDNYIRLDKNVLWIKKLLEL